MAEEAEQAMHAALDHLGIPASGARSGEHADLAVEVPGGARVLIELKATALPNDAWLNRVADERVPGAITVVVGDQISQEMRAALSAREVGWLDRRGHMRISAPGLFVDADVPPSPRHDAGTRVASPSIAGRAGLAAAAALLLAPEEALNASATARMAGLNPSSITRALKRLVAAQLVDSHGSAYRPLVPELFWELAEVWPESHTPVRLPAGALQETRLGLNAAHLDERGWALAAERGAVAWGAPIVLTADYHRSFYIPDRRDLVTAQALATSSARAITVLVTIDPIGLVTRTRFHQRGLQLPLAHPLFCALDLTRTSRDREALEQWTPPDGFTRVW
jgi:hypothetical protein